MADGKVVIDVILDDGSVAKGVADIGGKLGGIGDAGRKAGKGVMEIAAALGLVALARAGIDMLKASIDGAITRFDTLTQFPRVMEMIGFEAGESEKAINRLSEGVQGLPTRLDAVASTAQNIAVMTNDLDGAVETTLALNNAFLASGSSSADAERGLQQYVQMLSKGEVDLQSWRTLQETMGVGLNQLAKEFGFTGASAQNDLYDALKSGEITFDEFNAKLIDASNAQGGFADMALTASKGIRTSWENIKTAVVIGVAGVIGEIDKLLEANGFGGIQGVLERVKDSIKATFEWIITNIPKVVESFMNVYNTLEPWLPLIVSVIAAVVGMMGAWKLFNSVGGMVSGVMGSILSLKSGVMGLFKLLLANPWILMVGAAILAITMIILHWDTIKEFFTNLWESIKSITSQVWTAIEGVLSSAWSAITGIIGAVMRGIKGIIDNTWSGIKTTVSAAVNAIKSVISSIFNSLKGIVSSAFNGVKSAVSTGINGALKVVTNIAGKFKEAGRKIVTSIADGIKGAIGVVTGAISDVTAKIRSFLPFSPAKAGALRDIMDVQISESIAKSIDKGKDKAVRSMSNLASELQKGAEDSLNLNARLGVGRHLSSIMSTSLPGSGASNTYNNSKKYSPTINNYFTKEESTPSEVARRNKQQQTRLALEWGY